MSGREGGVRAAPAAAAGCVQLRKGDEQRRQGGFAAALLRCASNVRAA